MYILNESISLLFSVNVSDANKKRKYAVRSKTTSLNSDIFSYNFYCTSTQDAAKHDWHRISYLVRSQLQLWWPVYNNLSSCYIYIEEKMFFPKIWTFHWDRCIYIYICSVAVVDLRLRGPEVRLKTGALWWRHHTQPTVIGPFDQD